MQFEIFPVTAFAQNCSLVVCAETRRAAFVDPGGDIDHLESVAKAAGVQIEKILLTHRPTDLQSRNSFSRGFSSRDNHRRDTLVYTPSPQVARVFFIVEFRSLAEKFQGNRYASIGKLAPRSGYYR